MPPQGAASGRARAAEPAARKHVLFVFAHQDDECLISTRIAREGHAGHRVHCVFLTNGRGRRGIEPAVRDAESRHVLCELGVAAEDLHFLGTRREIDDLELSEKLDEALQLVEQAVGAHPIRRIYCLAWEGGHPDHDASHVVALAFGIRRGLLSRTWQFSAYHGRRLPWKLFRVAAPFARPGRRIRRRLSASEGLRHAVLCWSYPSQRRSWLGLFPELLVQRGVLRREAIDSVDPRALRQRPHPGRLLYESMFGVSYAAFERSASPFLDRHLPVSCAEAAPRRGEGTEPPAFG
jgi:LmbE family N-acetylglucosaminyl deacetylase